MLLLRSLSKYILKIAYNLMQADACSGVNLYDGLNQTQIALKANRVLRSIAAPGFKLA